MATTHSPDEHYDLIVIGSGMGSLATASLLAQFKKLRILVLESHFTLGGFLHSFKRKGYEWEPGFHYIGEMNPGNLTRGCMDLVTGGQVTWNKMEEFEHLIFPGATFTSPSGAAQHRAHLKQEFPTEADGIDRYFKDLNKIRNWNVRWFYSKLWRGRPASVISAGRKLAETTTQEYLDRNFDDPLLKAILAAQWGDYGTPPPRSAFGIHARVAADFLEGGYYPAGGSQQIADSAAEIVERHGGRCLTRHPVTEILIENNRAYGVEVTTRAGTKRFLAPRVVSGAGIDTTFNKLVPDRWAATERALLAKPKRGLSSTILYLGMKDDPRNHGFGDGNYWMFDRLNHGYEPKSTSFPPSIGNTTLSFASTRVHGADKHVGQLVSFSWYDDWSKFRDEPWRRRGDEYQRMKEQYTETLLDFAEERIPGLRPLIDYTELSTPVTVESMAGHVDGQVYGRECSPQRVKDQWQIETSVKNLYLTGTDLVLPGVNSALMIGVMTAAKLMPPLGIARLLGSAMATQRGKARKDRNPGS
jgi:phytoene dehydrogenase-like protein